MYLWRKRVNELNFKKINMNSSLEEGFLKIKTVVIHNGWSIIDIEPNSFIQAESKMSGGSWGELITILLINDQILINSITSPFKLTSVITFGNNKLNINKIMVCIEN